MHTQICIIWYDSESGKVLSRTADPLELFDPPTIPKDISRILVVAGPEPPRCASQSHDSPPRPARTLHLYPHGLSTSTRTNSPPLHTDRLGSARLGPARPSLLSAHGPDRPYIHPARLGPARPDHTYTWTGSALLLLSRPRPASSRRTWPGRTYTRPLVPGQPSPALASRHASRASRAQLALSSALARAPTHLLARHACITKLTHTHRALALALRIVAP